MIEKKLHENALLTSLVLLCTSFCLSGCNYIKQFTGGDAGQTNAPNSPKAVAQQTAPGETKGQMDGYWKLAFQFNDEVQSSHIRIIQHGDKFSGQGTDDQNNKPFLIENGVLRLDEVQFFKRYEQPDNPNQPPVEYGGKVDFKTGYMSGKYLISFQGKEIAGDWEAQKDQPEGTAQEQPPAGQQPPSQAPPPDKAPDLSGKWNMGFEYQFKTIRSTVFLEQINGKITGHGVDENTKEKFTIEKGWYSYPNVTLVRKYPAIKTKTGTKPAREMTFKATVTWVNESDYQGPYLSGKTDGGGNWEAQIVR